MIELKCQCGRLLEIQSEQVNENGEQKKHGSVGAWEQRSRRSRREESPLHPCTSTPLHSSSAPIPQTTQGEMLEKALEPGKSLQTDSTVMDANSPKSVIIYPPLSNESKIKKVTPPIKHPCSTTVINEMATRSCPKCQNKVPSTFKKCTHCGEYFFGKPRGTHCSNCGHDIPLFRFPKSLEEFSNLLLYGVTCQVCDHELKGRTRLIRWLSISYLIFIISWVAWFSIKSYSILESVF